MSRTTIVIAATFLCFGILWTIIGGLVADQLAHSPSAQTAWRSYHPLGLVLIGAMLPFVVAARIRRQTSHPAADWRSMVEHAEQGFWLIDAHAATIEVNRALGHMLGYTRDEMLGRTPFEFAAADSRTVFEAQVGTEDRAGHRHHEERPRHYEVNLVTRRGRILPTLFHATALRDSSGNLHGSYAFITDLTEIRERERELELMRHALEHSFDAIYRIDSEGRIVDANETACTALGYSRRELLALSVADIDSNFTQSELYREWDRLKEQAFLRFETTHRRKDGTDISVEMGLTYVEYGTGEYGFAIARDITEQKRQLTELQRAASVFDHSAEGVVITDPKRKIVAVNAAFTRITGYASDQVLGRSPAVLQSGVQDEAFYQRMWEAVRTDGVWRGEIWNRRKNGEIYPELLTISEVRNDVGELINYVGVFMDMTEMHQAQEQLAFRTYHDALTGLANRMLFLERLDHALAALWHRKRHLGVVMLDLSGFRTVNDSLGSEAGDAYLVEIAERLRSCLRAADTVARPGGDEFWILLEDVARREDVERVLQGALIRLREPFTTAGQTIRPSASVGAAIAPDDGCEVEQLVNGAATALHRAQREETEEIHYFRPEMHEQVRTRMHLEEALKVAIDEGQLRLWYQPQVDLDDGALVAAEALVRWEHPEWGLLSPADFIPVAEETGLVVPLGSWVLAEAVAQFSRWHALGLPIRHVAVNVAAAQLQAPEFYDAVAGALERTGLPGRFLELEITEQGFLRDVEAAVATIHRLSALGTRLAIDDFGTGYCSLAYLKRLPLDTLKIDKQFVDGLPDDEHDRSIVQAILAVARALDLEVVAEGVEYERQAEWLRENGVRIAQGYLYTAPRPPIELSSWLPESALATGPE